MAYRDEMLKAALQYVQAGRVDNEEGALAFLQGFADGMAADALQHAVADRLDHVQMSDRALLLSKRSLEFFNNCLPSKG